MNSVRLHIHNRTVNYLLGGVNEYDYCRATLAHNYNEETKVVGKKVTRKQVKELPVFTGC